MPANPVVASRLLLVYCWLSPVRSYCSHPICQPPASVSYYLFCHLRCQFDPALQRQHYLPPHPQHKSKNKAAWRLIDQFILPALTCFISTSSRLRYLTHVPETFPNTSCLLLKYGLLASLVKTLPYPAQDWDLLLLIG